VVGNDRFESGAGLGKSHIADRIELCA
jgi:hypothetical protein